MEISDIAKFAGKIREMEIAENMLFTGYPQSKRFNKLYELKHFSAQLHQHSGNSPLLYSKEKEYTKKS
jgi:hypothetical protein